MSEKLEWEFKLTDHVSGPAEHVGKSLHDVKGHSEGLIHKFHDLEHVAEMTFEAIAKAAEFGKEIFEAMEFKENALIGLEAVTQSAARAEEIYKDAQSFALATGQSAEEMINASKRLTQAGYAFEELRSLQQVLTDVKIMHGAGAMASVEEALVKMGTSGHVTERTMLSLNAVAGLGGKVQKNLADGLGVSAEQLKKMIAAGKVPAKWGEFAIAKGVAELEGGKLGSVTEKIANSLGGSIGQLKQEIDKAMRDLIDPESLSPLADFIRDIAHDGIPALMEGFKEVAPSIQEVLGVMKEIGGPSLTMKDVFHGIGEVVGYVAKGLAGVAYVITLIAKGWDLLIRGIDWGFVGEQIKSTFNDVVGWFSDLNKKMNRIGQDVIMGFVDGMKGVLLGGEIGALAALIPGIFRDEHKIKSPSRVFEEIGKMDAAGFERGLDGLNVDVPAPRSVGGGGGRGNVTFSPHISVSVTGGIGASGTGGGAEGSRRFADHIVDLAMEKLMGAFEELQLEAGS